MNRFLYLLVTLAEKFTSFGLNYYIATALFGLCILSALVAAFISVVSSRRIKGLTGLFIFYQTAFIVNVVLCVSDSEFGGGKNFTSNADAYAFCLSQFAVCMIFWLMLADKKVDKKQKSAEVPQKNSGIIYCGNGGAKCPINDLYGNFYSEQSVKDEDFRRGDNAEETVRSIELIDKIFCSSLPDINVAYINNLADALLARNITDEEREKLFKLKFALKNLNATPECIRNVNELLRFLLKKVAEYDIPA